MTFRRDELRVTKKMGGCYTRNKSNTKRTTHATSLAVSAPTRKISSSKSMKKALENTSREDTPRDKCRVRSITLWSDTDVLFSIA